MSAASPSTTTPKETTMTTTAPPATRAASTYVLDPAWHAERERLTSLTELYDGTTIRLAEDLGLAPGWHCAELGAGTGTVAQLLADRVGPDGSVLAVDTDTRFLDVLADDVLLVRRQDVATTPLPEGSFDLVHARLLLEHLPQRDAVLPAVADALAPGGWLLVEDFHWITTSVIDPPHPVHARVTEACRALMSAGGYDPAYGARLPRALRDAGWSTSARPRARCWSRRTRCAACRSGSCSWPSSGRPSWPAAWCPRPTWPPSPRSATTATRCSSRR